MSGSPAMAVLVLTPCGPCAASWLLGDGQLAFEGMSAFDVLRPRRIDIAHPDDDPSTRLRIVPHHVERRRWHLLC
jgi:hypothetical protein